MPKARRVSRARDKRADVQLQENIESTDKPVPHAETHSQSGNDTVNPSDIGAADITTVNNHIIASNPHSESADTTTVNGHITASNPHSGSASNADITALQQQIDDLEARVTALENA